MLIKKKKINKFIIMSPGLSPFDETKINKAILIL